MPRVTVMNLRDTDDINAIAAAVKSALSSNPNLEINEDDVDIVPTVAPRGFEPEVIRIDIDIWTKESRGKLQLQELAARVADAFKSVEGESRKVKVLIKPFDILTSGWVSL